MVRRTIAAVNGIRKRRSYVGIGLRFGEPSFSQEDDRRTIMGKSEFERRKLVNDRTAVLVDKTE